MIALWLCVSALLAVSPAYGMNGTVQTLRVNQPIAGVSLVTMENDQQLSQYAYNATEARDLCEKIGLTIASKAQVEEALKRGLETCRFGWVDEQIAVVPRINARMTCGQNGLGVVTWRAQLDKKFDVYCFNSSAEDAEPRNYTVEMKVVSVTEVETFTVLMLQPETEPAIAQMPARFVGDEESSSGAGKAVLISSACGLLIVAAIVIVYLKLRRRRSEAKQQTEDIETE